MLRDDLSIDPITNFPNLFGLLEAERRGSCGIEGVAIVFDIAALSCINNTYGRKAGDACVRGLAGLLRAKVNELAASPVGSPPVAFRVGGDEFLLVLPDSQLELGANLVPQIRADYSQRMRKHGIPDANLHTALTTYDHTKQELSLLLQVAQKAAMGCEGSADSSPQALPTWAEGLISHLAYRICDTLSLLRETRLLALTDEISGLPNHRAASLYLDNMLRDYQASGTPCSVLLVDGDNLKGYNEFGYQRGNKMIKDLGAILHSYVRVGDYVTRWLSGDEFVVLLPGAERRVAIQVAERLRAGVEKSTHTWPLPVTISIGVASCPTDGTTTEQLLSRMEERNMAAKRAGKNQVS